MPDHRACVEALTDRAGARPSAERLLGLFEAAFNSVWRRAQATLGTVTLTAIVNRVVYNATERHPTLDALKVSSDGIDCSELRRRLDRADAADLAEGLRYVLVEWLTVVGNLTAEILTPALHEALANVSADDGCPETDEAIVEERTNGI